MTEPEVKSDQQAIWDYHQGEGVSSFDGAESRLRSLARSVVGKENVLNIGIGNGFFEAEAEAQRCGVKVFALDPSERAVESLRSRLKLDDRAKVGYAQQMPFADSQFSAVVASEVLEHLNDQDLVATLREVYRVLKPGGLFLGTVPAREQLADQTIVCPCCEKQFHRWGHHQSFSTARVRSILEDRFHVESVFEQYFAPWNILNLKGRLICFLKLALLKLGIHGSDEKIVFRATKLG
jgi:ubiquinone/menaquinone biosynthesis C-methylase UbiE